MMYPDFLARKALRVETHGTTPGPTHESLYDFQRAIAEWAIRRGRAAVFADCGLGKTRIQLEWARQSGARALIVAPLAVAEQTVHEGIEMGIAVRHVARPADGPGIQITNYEKLDHFVGVSFEAIVLDESSILKNFAGKTRGQLIRDFAAVPRRLCCTATPAPNDIAELANHAEFLGVMTRAEMLATFFVHDDAGWRLKGHGTRPFYRWLAEWSVYIRRPSDGGFADGLFVLPELSIRDEVVMVPTTPANGTLFPMLGGVGSRAAVRRDTMEARVERAAARIRASREQWIVWCGLNDEGRALARALGSDAVLVEGNDAEDAKIAREAQWRSGAVQTLISKPRIFGFGMNWQHCARVMFLGLGDSYEQYYQAIRRCWRFGQKRPVEVEIVTSNIEDVVAVNVRRKEMEAARTAAAVIGEMCEAQTRNIRARGANSGTPVECDEASGQGWRLLLGDSCERLRELQPASVGLSVFSPPFASLYTYTASDRDLGNSKDYDQFFVHFGFVISELFRVTMPGRRCCVHIQQVPTTAAIHGVIGWRDFRADAVCTFVAAGWVYDGEVVIDKDPQAQAIRTKSKALLFVQKERDSSWLRPAMADYILLFRHPGENQEPIHPDVNNEEWILWARPIWYGIDETDTLNAAEARSNDDERHICPLQLGTIERCVRLWSNPGDLVLSPFAGIGSEGVVALRRKRRFVGIELKREYWRIAARHLDAATAQRELFAAGDAR